MIIDFERLKCIKQGISPYGIEGEALTVEERIANVIREVRANLYTEHEAVALLVQLVEETRLHG